MLDPTGFHQNFEDVSWAEMENFGLQRLVNRNPGIVEYVLINGKIAVSHGDVISEWDQVWVLVSLLRLHNASDNRI